MALAFACTLACAALPRAPGLYATSVTFSSAFDRAGLVTEPSGAVRFTTDLGTVVHLERGWLVQARAQLVDCLGVGGDVWDDWPVALGRALRPVPAFAGHGDGVEPASVAAPTALDLVRGAATVAFGTASFPEARYCRFHVLVAGVRDASAVAGAPEDVDLSALSLYLEGEVERADGTRAPLVVASTLSDGALTDLPGALVGDLDGSRADVVVTRRVATMLDGLALEDPALTEDEIARAALSHLDHEAVVELRVE